VDNIATLARTGRKATLSVVFSRAKEAWLEEYKFVQRAPPSAPAAGTRLILLFQCPAVHVAGTGSDEFGQANTVISVPWYH